GFACAPAADRPMAAAASIVVMVIVLLRIRGLPVEPDPHPECRVRRTSYRPDHESAATSSVLADQVLGVPGMLVDVARDEPAGRHDALAAGDRVVECALGQGTAQSLAAEGVVDFGVHEVGPVAALLVLGETGELTA